MTTHTPGLVLLDLVLPGLDGIALMESVAELADLLDGGWHRWDSASCSPARSIRRKERERIRTGRRTLDGRRRLMRTMERFGRKT